MGKNLGQFTVGWFLLSVLGGGLFGVVMKYVFEVRFTEAYKAEKERERRIIKYSYPLLQAANEVELRLQTILSRAIWTNWLEVQVINDLDNGAGFVGNPPSGSGYFYLSTLYVFAKYLAWVGMLQDETGPYAYYGGSKSQKLYDAMRRISNAFRYTELFGSPQSQSDGPGRDFTGLYRHLQSAIGELMLKEQGGEHTCISYREFFVKYVSDDGEQFRIWLKPLGRYFVGLANIPVGPVNEISVESGRYQVFRLAALQYWFFRLIQQMDPKFVSVHIRERGYDKVLLNRIPEPYRSRVANLPTIIQ